MDVPAIRSVNDAEMIVLPFFLLSLTASPKRCNKLCFLPSNCPTLYIYVSDHVFYTASSINSGLIVQQPEFPFFSLLSSSITSGSSRTRLTISHSSVPDAVIKLPETFAKADRPSQLSSVSFDPLQPFLTRKMPLKLRASQNRQKPSPR